ncbi:uncharacterized protein N7469_011347 [Penicillium citrinum]|uniref:Uncharacterized protein n=1 Tax=Penicillium citrinum TaxID=5077 RepID=A0A9W9ND72_PENCI|nr:uncharacterized protein N7469_011347 [Penicillium citrinum]KAJ5217722.1 hypothetical protein N7469_011347 [Penicillium citrinum]
MCDVILYAKGQESAIPDEALDNLPWSFLSWSLHRGLRDILVAYSKERMDRSSRYSAPGWDSQVVIHEMEDMASSAVLAGRGNSGDAVRVVTDIAVILWNGDSSALDETHFWRQLIPELSSPTLSTMAVIALTKCFVLEWSLDLDYQLYHDFPLELYFG